MSGPTHLWSGDWESESRQPAAAQPPVANPEPEPEPTPAPTRGRFSRRQFVFALGTGVAAAAVTVALVLTLGGQKPSPHHRAASASTKPGAIGKPQSSGGQGLTAPGQTTQSSQPTPVHNITGPSAAWMGMDIVTSNAGVVVSSVKLGSTADLHGFEPGDQILKINGRYVGTVSEITPDTSSVKLGGPVTIEVMRSSVQLTLAGIPMTQRPTIHP